MLLIILLQFLKSLVFSIFLQQAALIFYKRNCNNIEHSVDLAGRSDWDHGRWEWEDTPNRNNCSTTSRYHQPSPPLMLAEASPDKQLVSPWLDGYTPRSAGMLIIVYFPFCEFQICFFFFFFFEYLKWLL